LKALSRCIRQVGNPFSLRGVEATVRGWLVREDGQLVLRVSGSNEVLGLAPLRRKVQWDPSSKRAYPPTRKEWDAYYGLRMEWAGQARRIQVVGPLVEARENGPLILEVRQFIWGW